MGEGSTIGGSERRRRRQPRPATAERLRKAALAYIDRYATSAAHLRAVLMRRVDRSARLHGTDRAAGAAWADEIVAELVTRGLVDDRAFAETRANSLHRSGASRRRIAATLKTRGVGEDDIEAAIGALDERWPDRELAAACHYARRRRLGPWRAADSRAEHRERDLAALARAGFSYRIAERVVECDDIDALEDEARSGA